MKVIIILFMLFSIPAYEAESNIPKLVNPLLSKNFTITNSYKRNHLALDMTSASHQVYVSTDCRIIERGRNPATGTPYFKCKSYYYNLILIYKHIDLSKIKDKTYLYAEECIGKYNAEGNATGPHLHFEIIDTKNNPIEPWFI